MITIQIDISTNASEDEKARLFISRECIDEFLSTGFSEDAFKGIISFSCQPRAINPEYMQIIIDFKDIAESLIAWTTIFNALLKFCKQCKGYEPNLTIKRKKGDEEIEVSVYLDTNEDCKKIIKEIKKLLK